VITKPPVWRGGYSVRAHNQFESGKNQDASMIGEQCDSLSCELSPTAIQNENF
jgi:hypothetical protein